jgi:hypothetical protein
MCRKKDSIIMGLNNKSQNKRYELCWQKETIDKGLADYQETAI